MSLALAKVEKLTPAERRDLKHCINTVRAAQWAVQDASNVLVDARERKLYRENHDTFENFCRAAFGFSRQHAHNLIKAGEVFANLSTRVDTQPLSEGQVRLRSAADEIHSAYHITRRDLEDARSQLGKHRRAA